MALPGFIPYTSISLIPIIFWGIIITEQNGAAVCARKGNKKMAEKDISEKVLEEFNDVFADIINVLLFQGEEVISADELESHQPRSHYKADGRLREIERDVLKQWRKERLRLALLGLENQTSPDPDMSLRVMGYDGAEYRAQLNRKKEATERYPVITLVLYFGYKRRWNQPIRLLERLNVPEKFRPYVSDYKINVFEIAYLSREQVKMFKSDFRIVADYFVQMRESGNYIPSSQDLEHIQETLQLLSVMTGDRRFEEAYNKKNMERRPRNMCEVLDRIENRGWQKGRQEGENALALLMQKLFEAGRIEDAKKASENQDYRHLLMKELSIFPES